ncbi:Transcriptional activator somA [Fusarium oxysporum f. sp. phaseoli]
MKAITNHLDAASKHPQECYNKRTQLNTCIYEYFLHNGMFQCAQSILKADSDVRVLEHGPDSARDDKGCRLKTALCNQIIDTGLDSTHSKLLPAPNVPILSPDSCFLYEWFYIFWAMLNAQKSEDGRTKANQSVSHIQQQNWPRLNVGMSQTHSPLLLLHTPDSVTHNTFYSLGETGVDSIKPWMSGAEACDSTNEALQKFQMQLTSMEQQNKNELIARQSLRGLSRNDGIPGGRGSQGPPQSSKLFHRPALQASRPEPLPDTTKQVKLDTQPMNNTELDLSKAGIDGISSKVGVLRMNDWTRASKSRTCEQSNGQTTRKPVAAKETAFQQEGKTGHNGPVQWQNDSSENQIPGTSQCWVQGTLQERSRRPPVQPTDANDSVKPRSTISSLSQTSKAAVLTPQLRKASREKGPFPERTTPKKRTMNVKDEMVTCKIPKSNVGPMATHAAKTNPVPHINPVDIRKDSENTSLGQVVPTGQPTVTLPFTPAYMAANPPVDLIQSATFSMENSNVSVTCSLFSGRDESGLPDIDAFLESYSEDPGRFSLEPFSV